MMAALVVAGCQTQTLGEAFESQALARVVKLTLRRGSEALVDASPVAPQAADAPGAAAVGSGAPGSGAPGGPAKRGEPDELSRYVKMHVEAHDDPKMGHAVLLVYPPTGRVVPIFIGGTESLSIRLRMAKRRFSRPLTHDLLDDVVTKMGGRIVQVRIDELSSGVFIGSIVLEHGDRRFEIDARPSDAIALAIGNRVPIYVARKVLAQAGVSHQDLSPPSREPQSRPMEL
jgi:bifunctional DNase/RNase